MASPPSPDRRRAPRVPVTLLVQHRQSLAGPVTPHGVGAEFIQLDPDSALLLARALEA